MNAKVEIPPTEDRPNIAAGIRKMIALEDRTLQAELAGYRDFIQEVRYRLVPGIW